MSVKELLERIADTYTLEDVLYILGKDQLWLLSKIKLDILEHKDEFITGDDYYTRIEDE